MRALLRSLLVGILSLALIAMPLAAAPVAPLGVLEQAAGAQLGGSSAVPGATIFSGDRLTTDPTGLAFVHSGSTQLRLLENSTAVLTKTDTGLRAALERGSAGFSVASSESLELNADDAIVRNRQGVATVAKLLVAGPNELDIWCFRGVVEVVVDGEITAIDSDHAYRVMLVPDAPAAAAAMPVVSAKKRHAKLVAVLVFGAAAAVGTVAAVELFESEHNFKKPR